MKVLTVVGARPQFIKAAPVSDAFREAGIDEIFVHTGQHYHARLSADFFVELGLPEPDYNLKVGSGTHGRQTGRMLEALEAVMLREKPDWVLVYGDTNSTLAGALAAVKLHLPVAHVEAGIRSYNPIMAEEINRRITDNISTALLCPTTQAVGNLELEGFHSVVGGGELVDFTTIEGLQSLNLQSPIVFNCGDVMYDMLDRALPLLDQIWATLQETYPIAQGKFVLTTVHRPENTDRKEHLTGIIQGLSRLEAVVIWPLHPRTGKWLYEFGLYPYLRRADNIILTEPVGYFQLLALVKHAQCVVTDSGGIQKEAYLLGIPCLTCRNDTEWPQTVNSGWNKLMGLGAPGLPQAFPLPELPKERPNWFGDAQAARRIVKLLQNFKV